MKRLFLFLLTVVLTANMFAEGRTFDGTEVLYLNASAVSWWQDANAVQVATFDGSTKVVGVAAADPTKVGFTVPAGTYSTVVFSRHSSADADPWNKTGEISLEGTTENMVNTFAEKSTVVTWAHYDGAGVDKPACPDNLYMLGNIKNVGWTPGSGLEMTKDGQKFTATATFVAEGTNTVCYFCFTGANTNWDEINANRFGTTSQIVAGGSAVELTYPGEKTGTIAPGTYTITVDWETMTASAVAADPEPVVIAGTKLWPENAVLAASPEQVRILSLNNSLIHYETEFQDDMFNSIAQAMGQDAVWTAHTNLGKSLQYHYEEGDDLTEAGTPSAKALIRDNAYTHIILQEQSAKPRTNLSGFRESVAAWVKYIREEGANPNAQIIIPLNWAYNDFTTFEQYNTDFVKNYQLIAEEFGVTVTPVGIAYEQGFEAEGSDGMASWFKDDRHPTQQTTYMAACMEYANIMGIDATTITWQPTTITEEVAQKMRQYAQSALASYTQVVDQHNKTIRYSVHKVDESGMSAERVDGVTGYTVNAGGTMNDNVLTLSGEKGEYNVSVTVEEESLQATVKVADMVTEVVTIPSIKVNEDKNVVSENFESMPYPAADATADAKGSFGTDSPLPTAWRIERNQDGPRQIGNYQDASETTQYMGGVSLPSNAYNGTWNLGQTGSTDRALGGMTTGVTNGARAINAMVHLQNNGRKTFDEIKISYDIEKYREGSNANLFYVKLFTSTNGMVWTAAGDDFTYINPKGSGQTGFAVVPGATTNVNAVLAYEFEPGADLYLCWAISTSTGDNCASAPCLAIDNVNLEFTDQETTSIEQIQSQSNKVAKRLVDGKIIINRNGKEYNIIGERIY